ncbi:hypothetical protein CTheo_1003 [Ceratobasidium theobromae]|uniref:tRNA (guanine(9)-N1)-methyltransferase n=1 Tax=Ceratobasidium theobromae TaxID=1582974 RepID=A0A5N5QUV3_9AGAM|nr:hypothetical protein CTheo_1003 [Ceratobasidium theobromae]
MSTEPSVMDMGVAEPSQDVNDSTSAPLSKSAQKRLARSERFVQLKLERRAREKAQKAAKRKEREERAAAGKDVGPSDAKKRRVSREGQGPLCPFDVRIVIDLGFDEKMTEKEIGSMCSQLAYTYASHRRTKTPFTSLLFTSLNGRLRKQLDSINDGSYRRWRETEWWEEDIDALWNSPPQPTEEPPPDVALDERPQPTEPESSNSKAETAEPSPPTLNNVPPTASSSTSSRPRPRNRQTRGAQTRSSCSQESVVYLTADAQDELLELKQGETYIIGGLVDRNRHKNLCANKAQELKIRSARLPIGRYLADMPTRKVLTVNQVFDILVYWVSTRDWEEALQKVMPKRKFNAEGKRGKRSKQPSVDDPSEADSDEEPTAELDIDDDNEGPTNLDKIQA